MHLSIVDTIICKMMWILQAVRILKSVSLEYYFSQSFTVPYIE